MNNQQEAEALEEIQYYSNLIAYNVRRYRDLSGINQEELAKRCGVSRKTIVAVENYKYQERIGRHDTLIKIARGLGVMVWQLYLAKKINEPNTTECRKHSGKRRK